MTPERHNLLRMVALIGFAPLSLLTLYSAGRWVLAPGGHDNEAEEVIRMLSLLFCWAPSAFISTRWRSRRKDYR